MEPKENSLDQLWRGLESDALAQQPDEPVEFEPPATKPIRRRTLTDKFFTAVLSGFVPAYLLMVFGLPVGLFALEPTSRLSILAVALLLALPIAALIASLLRTEKQTPPRVLLLAIAVGSLGTVGLCGTATGVLTTSLAITSNDLTSSDLLQNLMSWAKDLEKLYAAQLHPLTLVASVLAAALVWGLVTRARHGAPWLEPSNSRKAWMNIFACATLFSPWLFLGGCMALQGRIAPKELAWLSEQKPPRLALGQIRHPHSKAWRDLRDAVSIADSAWSRNSDVAPTWTTSYHRELENKVHSLQDKKPMNGADVIGVIDSLLHRPLETQDPIRLAFTSLEHSFDHRASSVERQVARAAESLVESLAKAPLSTEKLLKHQARLLRLLRTMPSPEAELNQMMLRSIAWELDDTLTGINPKSDFGILGVVRETFVLRRNIRPWLEVMKDIDYTDYRRFEISTSKASASMPDGTTPRWVLDSASGSCYSLLLRPSLESAERIVELRLFRASHGAYPKTLAELKLPKDASSAQWSYKTDGRTALLSRTAEGSKTTSWTLP